MFFTDHYKNYPAVLIRLADITVPVRRDAAGRLGGSLRKRLGGSIPQA